MQTEYMFENVRWADRRKLAIIAKARFRSQFDPRPPKNKTHSKAIWLGGNISIQVWVE